MAHRSRLRASDADRDQIVERLRQAATEGRLRPDELEHRLGAALTAATYGELDALVADLPVASVNRRSRSSIAPWVPPVVALALAIPVALAVIAVVVFVVTGLFVGWLLWLFLGWWFFAGRRRAYVARGMRYHGRCGGYRHYTHGRTQARGGFWL
jgi:small-conductance mechanosensitive channel